MAETTTTLVNYSFNDSQRQKLQNASRSRIQKMQADIEKELGDPYSPLKKQNSLFIYCTLWGLLEAGFLIHEKILSLEETRQLLQSVPYDYSSIENYEEIFIYSYETVIRKLTSEYSIEQ